MSTRARQTAELHTSLYSAAHNGHEGVVELLLEAEADVDKATADGFTPLYGAAFNGQEGVVEQLLMAGANPNTEKFRGTFRTPLSVASYNGHSKVCSLLFQYGANMNNGDEGPALKMAVTQGHREVAVILMQHGASSDAGELTQPELEDLTNWMAVARKEERFDEENNRQMEQMVLGIPELCVQAASSMAAPGHNGDGISSAPAVPLLCRIFCGCVRRKHKAS